MEEAIALLVEGCKTVAEGAGAAGIAALLAFPDRFAGRRVGIPVCGGNIDARILANVLLRNLMRDGRLRIEIEDALPAPARPNRWIAAAEFIDCSFGVPQGGSVTTWTKQ